MQEKNLYQIIEMSEDASGRITFAPKSVYGKMAHWKEAEGDEVSGDGVANGTIIVSLSIPAETQFACMSLMASSDLPAVLNIASGTIGTHTDIYHIDLYSAQGQVLITEDTPIFVYNNTTAAAVTLLMIAPQTAKGVATNNDVNHQFHGYIGGILL
jgi:hypothetical protein